MSANSKRVGLSLFVLMFIQWFVLTVDFRALAGTQYGVLFVSDMLTALVGFTILKKVQEAGNAFECWCYALGGSIGSQAALYLCAHYLK